MNLLIFDSVRKRAQENAAAFPSSVHIFLKRGNEISTHPTEEPSTGSLDCDLVLLHADGADEELLQNHIDAGTVKAASILRFSGGGCEGGIPWPVRVGTPLTESVAKEIVSVCERFSPSQREQEFKQMWCGVPELLLAWTLAKHFALDLPPQCFLASEVATSYNQLRGTVSLRSGSKEGSKEIPAESPEGLFPRIEDAKLLIELSRVDL